MDNEESDVDVKAKQPFLKRGQGVQRRLQYAAEGKQYVPKGGFVYNTGNAEDDPNNRPSKTFLFKLAKLNNGKQPRISLHPPQPSRTARPAPKPCLQVSTFTRLQSGQHTVTAAAVPDDFDRAVLQEVINHSQQRATERRAAAPRNPPKDAPAKEAPTEQQDVPQQSSKQGATESAIGAPPDHMRLAAAELQRQRAELDKDRATLRADRALFEKQKADAEARAAAQLREQQSSLQQERKRVERRAVEVERRALALTRLPSRKERAEIEALTTQLEQQRAAAQSHAAKQQLTISRLRQQLSKAQAAQRELMEEVRWYEAKQLDGWARAHRTADRAARLDEVQCAQQLPDSVQEDLPEPEEHAGEDTTPPGDGERVDGGTHEQGKMKDAMQVDAAAATVGMGWSPAVVPAQHIPPVLPHTLFPAAWQPLACPSLPSLPWHSPLVHHACCTVSDAVDRFRANY